MDEVTRPIADYAAGLRFEEIPEEIVAAAVLRLVDTLGCALGGYHSPQAAIGRRLARGSAPVQYAGRVLGTRDCTSAEPAAFANVAAVRYLDFNDTYPGGHPSDCTGALLALAECARADSRQLLTSLVVAYETFGRLIRVSHPRGGWAQGFATGIATAAGLGSLLRLPAETIAHALAITAVSNVSLGVTTTGTISQWKGAATAFAARNALFATLLAAEGTTGPAAPFSGRNGVWAKVTGPFDLEPFGARGGAFLLPLVRIKYWPVQYEAQAAVWAALELRGQLQEPQIRSIVLATYRSAWRENGPEKWDPRTRETADHSLPYLFARALVDGSIDARSFAEPAVLDPALRPVMAKIQVQPDDAIDAAWPATIELRATAISKNGRRREVHIVNPRGHEANPMTADDVAAKFRALAMPLLGAERTEAALHAWWRVAEAPAIGPLFDALAVETP